MLKMWESIGGDEIIAQLVERDQIPNFLKEAVVGPNEAMIYLRNGKIEDVLTQDKVKIQPQGITGWFKSKMGGGDLVQILYVNTGVFDLEVLVGKELDPETNEPLYGEILSKDYEEISGTCTMRIQINQNNVKQIFNLMRSRSKKGDEKDTITEKKSNWADRNLRKILSFGLLENKQFTEKATAAVGKFLVKTDLENKVKSELVAKVLYPQLAAVDAKELRGNLDLIKQIETATEIELRKSFELWGMNLVQFFTVFDRTASDLLAKRKRDKMRVFEEAEFNKDIDIKSAINDQNRQYESDKNEQEKRWAMSFGEQAGDNRLREMELDKDKLERSHEITMSRMEFDEELRQKRAGGMTDVDLKRADMNVNLERDRGESDIAMDAFERLQKQKRDRIAQEQAIARQGIETADAQIKQLQSEIHELEMKIIDAPDSKAQFLTNIYNSKTEQLRMLQTEATKRQLGTVGGDAGVAFMNAEGQKYNMDTYKSAEDRERRHQVDMTSQAANLMQASKQNVPQYVGGGGYMQPQPAVNVVTVNQEQKPQHQMQGGKCPGCGDDVKPNWKSCPGCGGALGQSGGGKCPSCGEDVKPNWKSCPGCGAAIGQARSNNCPSCGDEVKPNWKSCPGCGARLG